ncbi:plasmid mobilization relaxosome protein MobC [Acetobacter indonesiensis]|uniref:plasmid mobilization relaxosome protein MobC n=1 Tax=Acetobacter indonesiensis TaxID=104101 RepID=UPI001FD301BE|nr:plasmid mobilization relaxosome protein MobC [Acetobacter indonesiensis]
MPELPASLSEPVLLNWTAGTALPATSAATTAHWIRALLATSELAGDDGQQVGSELYSLRHALSRIGNNLNQLAHSAHCGDHIHCGKTLTELEDRLHQIDGLLAQLRSRPPRRRCARPAKTLH